MKLFNAMYKGEIQSPIKTKFQLAVEGEIRSYKLEHASLMDDLKVEIMTNYNRAYMLELETKIVRCELYIHYLETEQFEKLHYRIIE